MLTLTEGNVGRSAGEILYPHVSTCMTLTLQLDDGRLVGAHLSAADPSDLLEWILEEMAALTEGVAIRRVYAVGVVDAWADRGQEAEVEGFRSFTWHDFADTVRAVLHLPNQDVYTFDSRGVASVTHIRVAPAMVGHCGVKVASAHLYELVHTAPGPNDTVHSVRGGTSISFGVVLPKLIDGGSAPMNLVKRTTFNNFFRAVKVVGGHNFWTV